MGQVCSGTSEEASKSGLLDVPSRGDDHPDPSLPPAPPEPSRGEPSEEAASLPGSGTERERASEERAELLEQRKREEEALERKQRELWIVNGAARGMVSVRSTRGSTGYYDQGFAGLLAQHLEQTTSFPDRLPLVLPPNGSGGPSPPSPGASSSSLPPENESGGPGEQQEAGGGSGCSFYDRLARSPWGGMDLAVEAPRPADTHAPGRLLQGRELAAALSGDPHKLMDALAESLLDGPYTVVPARQQLFAGVRPMVETLM